ncbi:hypothetical protein RRG08_050815 [Elysia crispata]|uniref:Uncharacterized protein n=1 Tax=Elysia crispata TaxID=231223 RepID=A0AAE1ADB6_9GAST|nr:hypothetical protein RRG08_050815 [Elysia crispata]
MSAGGYYSVSQQNSLEEAKFNYVFLREREFPFILKFTTVIPPPLPLPSSPTHTHTHTPLGESVPVAVHRYPADSDLEVSTRPLAVRAQLPGQLDELKILISVKLTSRFVGWISERAKGEI